MQYRALILIVHVLLDQSSAQILPFRTFTIHDGLPSNQIRAVCQDARGYLWVGTYGGGVATFDGTTFRSRNVPSGIVWALAPSSFVGDAVWLGTWGGLCRADAAGISVFLPEDSRLSRSLFTVMEDRNGNVWCGTSNGVQILAPGARSPVPFYPDTSFGHVVKICQSSDGTIYIGSREGLWSYHSSRGLKRLGERARDQKPMVLALYLDRSDTLWVGRWDRMLLRYHRDVLIDSLLIPEGYVHQMAEDSSGNLWCASSQGVVRIQGRHLSREAITWYRAEHGLPESAHRAVYVDAESNIWFGSAFKGLSHFAVGGSPWISRPQILAYRRTAGHSDQSRFRRRRPPAICPAGINHWLKAPERVGNDGCGSKCYLRRQVCAPKLLLQRRSATWVTVPPNAGGISQKPSNVGE